MEKSRNSRGEKKGGQKLRKTIKRRGERTAGLVNFIRASLNQPSLASLIERNKTWRNNEDYLASVLKAFDEATYIIRLL